MSENEKEISIDTKHSGIMHSHDIDFIIHGADMQFVEMSLDPGEVVVGETGAMMFMDDGIGMSTKMSDGSEKNSGIFGSLMGAAKRSLTGEKFFMTFFTNQGHRKARLAFAAPYPGMIIPIELDKIGTPVLCQKEGFLCGTKGISIGLGFTKRIGAGLFGGEGYILQKLEGNGVAFIHSGGAILERNLGVGQKISVDTGSLVAFQASVDFDIKMVRGFSNMVFGGEDLFLTELTGPGKVWIQSMPYPRLVLNIRNTLFKMDTGKEKKGQ